MILFHYAWLTEGRPSDNEFSLSHAASSKKKEALSGTSSQRFTVSPASISIFWGCGWLVLVVFLFLFWGFGCLCWFVFVLFVFTSEIF